MKNFVFKSAVKAYAEEAVASLFWCENKKVLVDKDDNEVGFFEKTGNEEWKPLWKVLGYFPYTTRTYTDYKKETSEFNFSIGGINNDETRGLACLLYDVWFGYVERKYHKSDNKTALKLQNRLTGKIVYMGWYDERFTVTEREAVPDPDFPHEMFEINED